MDIPIADQLNTDTDAELHPDHPPHVTSTNYRLWESDIPDSDPRHRYRCILLQTWDCNCMAGGHKRKTLHFFRLDSLPTLDPPDSRVYSVLCLLGSIEYQGESPHAQKYRGRFEEQQLLDDFRVGSVSDIVDLTDKLYSGEIVLDEDAFQLCDCDQYPSPHAPHLTLNN
jgi:hypothetical protein